MGRQCPSRVRSCRARLGQSCLLHPQKLPRQSPAAAAVKGQKRHFALQQLRKPPLGNRPGPEHRSDCRGCRRDGPITDIRCLPETTFQTVYEPDIGLEISGTITYSELMLLGRCRKAIKVLSSHRVLLSTLSSPPILWLAMEICAFL
jgi:hypothetical protein